MEHLLQPSQPACLSTVAPCLSFVAYDQLDFETYPQRRGFDRDCLRSGDFTQRPPDETAAFLQDWLYFGLLWATLGDDATKSAYVVSWEDQHFVTTAKLDQHIGAYRTHIEHLRDVDNAQCWDLMTKAEKALEELDYFCCLTERHSVDGRGLVTWPVPPEVDLSLRVLGQRITSAYRLILGPMQWDHFRFWLYKFPSSRFAFKRLMEDNWCPSEVTRAVAQYSASTLYYMSLMYRPRVTRDHTGCTSRKCLAFQVDSKAYRTKHVESDCECFMLGPDYQELTSIISRGGIPLITIDVDTSKHIVKVLVEKYTPGTEYIAISHVWADGLGNNDTNSLPKCQLLKLKASLDLLRDSTKSMHLLNTGRLDAFVRKKRNLSLRFWMDTLCIPVGESEKPLRKKSIASMKDIYSNSYQVLVLDAELQSESTIDTTEALMRISLSGWMRRLWTLQEAVLGLRLHFRFGSAIMDLQKSYNEFQYPEDFTLRMDNAHGSTSSDSRQFFWKMRALRQQIFPEEPKKFMGKRTVMISYSSPDEDVKRKEEKRCYGVMEAFEAARYRTTSRAEDVYPCLANLLGWDSVDIYSVPQQHRLHLMLETQSSLPQGILFIPGPRRNEHGWRWAVTSFDNDPAGLMQIKISDSTPATRTEQGLTVEYQALILPNTAKLCLTQNIAIPAYSSPSAPNTPDKTWWFIQPLPSQFHSHTLDSNPQDENEKDIQIRDPSESAPLPLDELVSETDTLAILFYSQSTRSLFRRVQMPAAIVAISESRKQDIWKSDSEDALTCRFIGLGIVEIVGGHGDVDVLMRRRDLDVTRVDEVTGFVKRRWTVQ